MVGDYVADLLVADVVLVELKVAADYDSRDEAQVLSELKATGVKVGLLINFGRTKFNLSVSSFNPCSIRVHPWQKMSKFPPSSDAK